MIVEWRAQPHHEAFPGMLNGGIVSDLLGCHSNWTAAWHSMNTAGVDRPPAGPPRTSHLRMRGPTLAGALIRLRAAFAEGAGDRAVLEAPLQAEGKVTGTDRGIVVAEKERHPAIHRC